MKLLDLRSIGARGEPGGVLIIIIYERIVPWPLKKSYMK